MGQIKYNPINNPFLKNLWLWKCGLPEEDLDKPNPKLIEELFTTEWSNEFEQLMRNRLVMGGMRYGKMRSQNKKQYDRITSIESRLLRFRETGNKEYLIDIANLCLLEFEEGNHPTSHFESIDDGEHVKTK